MVTEAQRKFKKGKTVIEFPLPNRAISRIHAKKQLRIVNRHLQLSNIQLNLLIIKVKRHKQINSSNPIPSRLMQRAKTLSTKITTFNSLAKETIGE